jgi:hypothetical protein
MLARAARIGWKSLCDSRAAWCTRVGWNRSHSSPAFMTPGPLKSTWGSGGMAHASGAKPRVSSLRARQTGQGLCPWTPLGPEAPDPRMFMILLKTRFQGLVLGGVQGQSPWPSNLMPQRSCPEFCPSYPLISPDLSLHPARSSASRNGLRARNKQDDRDPPHSRTSSIEPREHIRPVLPVPKLISRRNVIHLKLISCPFWEHKQRCR